MNNKPFNAEKAKAGEPVVTNKGLPAIYRFTAVNDTIHHHHVFTYTDDKDREWVTVVNDEGLSADTGSWITNPARLYMAPVTKTVWVNIWRSDGDIRGSSHPFPTKEEALRHISTTEETYIGTYPIEIEL